MGAQARPLASSREDSILESFVSLGGGVVLSRIVAFIGTAYLARTLGTYAFGIVGFAAAITMFLALSLRMGFEPVGARETARDPESAAVLAAGVSLLRLGLALIGLGILSLVTLLLDKPPEVRAVMVLTGLLLLPLAFDLRWVYRGLARNRLVGISMILAQIVYVTALLLWVKGPADIFWAPLALALGEAVAVGFLAVPLLKGWSGKADLRRAWSVLRSSGFLVSSSLLGALIRTTDIVLIALLLGEAQVGVFSAAYRVCYLIMAIALSLHAAYLPRLARFSTEDLPGMGRLADLAFEAAASLAIPFVVGGWILATPILSHLFGADFAVGRDAFRLLLLATGLFFLHGIFFQILVVFDKTRPELIIRGTAAGLNLLLNILLIPRYGIEGAAFATVSAELVIFVWRRVVCRQIGVKVHDRLLWKPMAAAFGMAAVMISIAPRVPWLVTFTAGGLAYLLLLVLLRGFPRDLRPQTKSGSTL